VLQIDTVKQQKVGEFDVVDGAETIKLKDAGDGIGIFDLREPCVGNVKFGIAFGFGDLMAELRDFTRGDAETATNVLELFAGRVGAKHGGIYLKTVK
jgi:hypothetical protein